jgi:UDP-3-O-[3-hydroxymyristoyl] glucosamine N-acyltransferase
MDLCLKELLGWISSEYRLEGEWDGPLEGFADLEQAIPGDISFVQDRKYAPRAKQCKATVLLAPFDLQFEHSTPLVIRVDNPSRVLSELCGMLESRLFPIPYSGIDRDARVAPDAMVDEEVSIGAFSTVDEQAVIGRGSCIGRRVTVGSKVTIGKEVVIADNVVIGPHTEIGDHCRIHSGVVIGAPGFGYQFDAKRGVHAAIPQIGRVIIGNHVDIGANTTIDRARIGVTSIGDGTKIDNLVQIGHNCRIGKHNILCAQTGTSGSVTTGDYVIFGGRVAIADHVHIGAGTQMGGGTGVLSDIAPNSRILGAPAMDFGLAMKVFVLQKRLPELFKRLQSVEATLENLCP